MNGELDFSASLKERVGLLKGVPADVFDKLKSVLTISPGARELCRALKVLGYRIAVLSGGFQPLAEWLAEQLGIDHAVANHVSHPYTDQKLQRISMLIHIISWKSTQPPRPSPGNWSQATP